MTPELLPDVETLPALVLTGWQRLPVSERAAAAAASWTELCAQVEDGERAPHPFAGTDMAGDWAWDISESAFGRIAPYDDAQRRSELADDIEARRAETHDVAPQSTNAFRAPLPAKGQISLLAPNGSPWHDKWSTLNLARSLGKFFHEAWLLRDAPLTRDLAICFDGESRALFASGESWPLPWGVQNCSLGRWTTVSCLNGHNVRVWTGCCRVRCEHCAGWVGKRRARRAWRRCLGGFTQRIGVVTLTIPPEHRAALTRGKLRAFWQRAYKAFESFAAVAWPGAKMGAAGWFHPTGSVDVCTVCGVRMRRQGGDDEHDATVPVDEKVRVADKTRVCCGRVMKTEDDDRWHPHFNLLFPMVDLAATRVGRLFRGELRYFLDDEKLQALKNAWQAELSAEVGAPVRTPVVYYGWRGDDDERTDFVAKQHALRYFARTFPSWSEWTSYTRWFGAANPRNWAATREHMKAQGAWREPPRGCCAQCGARLILRDVGKPQAWDGNRAEPLPKQPGAP